MNLEDFLEITKRHNVEKLENVLIEGDLEIEVEEGADISSILPYLAIIQEMQNFLYHTNVAMSFVTNLGNAGVVKGSEKGKS